MDRDTVRAGLRAYRLIDTEIESRWELAEEIGDAGRGAAAVAELRAIKREFAEAMEDLPALERELIRRHYIEREGWVRLARKYAYTERHVRNIAGWGLDRLGRTIQKSSRLTEFCTRSQRLSHH